MILLTRPRCKWARARQEVLMCDRFPISLLWTFSPACWQRKLIQFFSLSPHVSFSLFLCVERKWCIWFFRLDSKRIECVTLDIYCTPFSHKCRVRVFAECFSFYIYFRAELLCARVLSRTRSVTKWKVLHSLFSLFASTLVARLITHGIVCMNTYIYVFPQLLFLFFSEIICDGVRDWASVWKQLTPRHIPFGEIPASNMIQLNAKQIWQQFNPLTNTNSARGHGKKLNVNSFHAHVTWRRLFCPTFAGLFINITTQYIAGTVCLSQAKKEMPQITRQQWNYIVVQSHFIFLNARTSELYFFLLYVKCAWLELLCRCYEVTDYQPLWTEAAKHSVPMISSLTAPGSVFRQHLPCSAADSIQMRWEKTAAMFAFHAALWQLNACKCTPVLNLIKQLNLTAWERQIINNATGAPLKQWDRARQGRVERMRSAYIPAREETGAIGFGARRKGNYDIHAWLA